MTATKKPLCVSIAAPLFFLLVFFLCGFGGYPLLIAAISPVACGVVLIEILLFVCSLRNLVLCRPKWPSAATLFVSGVVTYFLGCFTFLWLFVGEFA